MNLTVSSIYRTLRRRVLFAVGMTMLTAGLGGMFSARAELCSPAKGYGHKSDGGALGACASCGGYPCFFCYGATCDQGVQCLNQGISATAQSYCKPPGFSASCSYGCCPTGGC
jgi:hypothetical protein